MTSPLLFGPAAPGSLRWLVGKQLRWQWQGLTPGQRTLYGVLLGLLLLGGGLAYLSLRGVLRGVDLGQALPEVVYLPLGGALLFLFTLMVSAAVAASLEALFTRGDLDLLLHSPLSPRVVLASRALGVALSSATALALFAAPALLLALALGAWRGLGLVPWLAGASLLSASVGLWITLGLVRLIGVRRTRTVASVIGALTGGALFLALQWSNLAGRDSAGLAERVSGWRPGSGGWPAADHPMWYPVRTLWFEPWPALAFVGVSVALFAVTVATLTRQFAAGVQEVGENGGARSRAAQKKQNKAAPLQFVSGRRATLLKEWRLIARDPELLSRTLLQLVYLLPILVPVARQGGLSGAAGAAVVLLTGSLATALANITLNAEEAPDLLRCAPRGAAALRTDKALAAVIPTTLLGGVGLAALAAQGTLGGFGGALQVPLLALSTVGSALLVLWRPLPVRRADLFKNNQGPGLVGAILQLAFQFSLAATAFAASREGVWGLGTLALALITLALSYSLRRDEAGE